MTLLDDHRWLELRPGWNPPRQPVPALFLDRDGVIIEDHHYMSDPDQVEVFPGVAQKLGEFAAAGIPVIVVTNQSGIGRGYFTWTDFELVHRRVGDLCATGYDAVVATLANSFLPGHSSGDWRKPSPGMFHHAARELNVDLSRSAMVGDKVADLEAARTAGVGRLIHVLTGQGRNERPEVVRIFPDAELADSLADVTVRPPGRS